jgi:cysteine desulfurase/selenocysteine lyase
LPYDVDAIRLDFPTLALRFGGKPPIYFDNACTTLRPRAVIDAVADYYTRYPSCHGRTMHRFGRETTEKYRASRDRLARFIGAGKRHRLVFVRNVTEAINLVARGLSFEPGQAVVTGAAEHNSNLLPWQRLARDRGGQVERRIVPLARDLTFDFAAYEARLDGRVRLVSFAHTSNLTGCTIPAREVVRKAHEHGALVFLDGAQSAPHHEVDVERLGVDFFAFSCHKMLGPSGFGVLCATEEALKAVEPLLTGGETVLDSTYEEATFAGPPDRYEAGLQDYAGAIGAAAAADYLDRVGKAAVHQHEIDLNRHLTDALLKMPGVHLLGPTDPALRGGIANFCVDGFDPIELAMLLDRTSNIMVRAGVHCVHSWFHASRSPQSIRVSFYLYNTHDEVDLLIADLARLLKHYR